MDIHLHLVIKLTSDYTEIPNPMFLLLSHAKLFHKPCGGPIKICLPYMPYSVAKHKATDILKTIKEWPSSTKYFLPTVTQTAKIQSSFAYMKLLFPLMDLIFPEKEVKSLTAWD